MPLQRREDRLARVAQTGEKKFPVLDKTVNCQGGVTSWVRRKKMPICPQDPYHILRCPLLIHTSYWVPYFTDTSRRDALVDKRERGWGQRFGFYN